MENESVIKRDEITILNQLIAAQNMLYVMPSNVKRLEFIAGTLKQVPAIELCSFYSMEYDRSFGDDVNQNKDLMIFLRDFINNPAKNHITLDDGKEILLYNLQTTKNVFGVAIIRINDKKEYNIFRGAVNNIINILVIIMENEKQQTEVRNYTEHLEEILKVRTTELNLEVEKHKQLLEIIKQSEEKYRRLHESITDSYLQVNNEGRIIEVNRAFCDMTGYKESELLEMSLNQIIPQNWLEYESKILTEEALSEGVSSAYEIEYIRNDKTKFPVELRSYLIVDNDNLPTGRWAIVRDISRRKAAEEALKESEHRLNDIIDKTNAGYFFIDTGGTYQKINDAFIKMHGYDNPEELLGKSYSITQVDPNDINGIAIANSLINGKSIPAGEYTRLCKDGSIKHHKFSAHPAYKSGKIIGFEGFMIDSTEQKTAEEIIKQHNKQLEDLNKAKDKFFSIIAHDLKAPFSGFMGLTQLMAENIDLFGKDELRQISTNMNESAKNFYKLLENLLEWSRMQTGKIEFTPELIRISNIVNNNIKLVSQIAGQKGIIIKSLIPEFATINADINMVNTIVRNLISNAIKFTKPGGEVKIGIDDSTESERTDNFVELYVSDNGIGMSKDKLDELFRLDVEISTKGTLGEQGTGLGLLLCKEFIERHGGKIKVISTEGVGTKFSLLFPS